MQVDAGGTGFKTMFFDIYATGCRWMQVIRTGVDAGGCTWNGLQNYVF